MQTLFFLHKSLFQRWLHCTMRYSSPIFDRIFSAKRHNVQQHYLTNRRHCDKPVSQRKLGLIVELDVAETSEHTEESDEESHRQTFTSKWLNPVDKDWA